MQYDRALQTIRTTKQYFEEILRDVISKTTSERLKGVCDYLIAGDFNQSILNK